jgi:hypothetical protein
MTSYIVTPNIAPVNPVSQTHMTHLGHGRKVICGASQSRSSARKAHAWAVPGWLKPSMDSSELPGYLALGFTALFALAVIAAILWAGNVGWP